MLRLLNLMQSMANPRSSLDLLPLLRMVGRADGKPWVLLNPIKAATVKHKAAHAHSCLAIDNSCFRVTSAPTAVDSGAYGDKG